MNEFIRTRLLDNNAALVQMLGLCPLLAVSNTAINALGMGLATIVVVVVTNLLVSLIRPITKKEIRIPLFVLLIASVVTTLEMMMNAYFHQLYLTLGIFIPLIVTNCLIMARAEAFASKNAWLISVKDGFFVGLGFALVMFVIGIMREVIGQGTLFSQAHLLFGQWGHFIELTLFPNYDGFLLAILPPGAFFALAILVAIKNKRDMKIKASHTTIVSHD
ncbi:electron transport complex subunit E [Marinicella sp. S1101]|uniref:electron transport complex subunit E n=1 Tax=Marinicella marina TaxID=2996016 RepID=UPI002260AFCC|nr:electron transport complex subunit E [Marinicella marina]MCX7552658.1 electron transport complex subunit E [Marinicella marina]MDJ1139534.1 electron transport complex subunit E [Marinicella marina]